MTIQQQLAERMYELLPHKKELEFGCEIKGIDRKYIAITVTNNRLKHTFPEDKRVIVSDKEFPDRVSSQYFNKNFEKDTNFKIIGQPLRLADVFQAIEVCRIEGDKIKERVKEMEDFKESPFIFLTAKIVAMYIFETDDITKQKDKFCEFVYDLIK